jgi:hypothetical protein
MEKYLDMKKRHSQELEALPIAWAFNKSQFEEGMEKLGLTVEDTDKICKIGGGGFMKKVDADLLSDCFLHHNEEFQNAVKNDVDGTGFMFEMFDYELANHEYNYTGDVFPTLEALGISMDEVENNPAMKKALESAKMNQY